MRLSLASKISITIVGVLALALLSSIVAIGSAYRFEGFQETLADENLERLLAAEELEISLLEQRGYVASFILDGGNTTWLEQLEGHCDKLDYWLGRARQAAGSDEERRILDELEGVHGVYVSERNRAIQLYKAGEQEQAKEVVLQEVNTRYREAFDLCEEFIAANQRLVDDARKTVRREVKKITLVITATLITTVGLGVVLLWLFFRGVVFPLRRMAAEVRSVAGEARPGTVDASGDELRKLGHYVELLMTDVAETRSDLEHSRTQLAHADKLAAVGRLAASMAHEIRNPLTSVKMWLYSLRRSVGEDGEVQQKFDMISDEVARLESIVRSFLEFARPTRLQLRPQPIAPLLDKTVELVRQCLDDQRIAVVRQDEDGLPEVMIDEEQLKQVFLNLIKNAMEAMPEGGELRVSCAAARRGGCEMVAVRLADSGPGMTKDVQQRVFEPFFTTKEEGTGLGLCVAASTMARHAGLLELESTDSHGTRWIVWIPAVES